MNKVLILSNKIPYPAEDGSSIAMARLLEAFEATNAFEIGIMPLTQKSILRTRMYSIVRP
jgi:hypothetical protein